MTSLGYKDLKHCPYTDSVHNCFFSLELNAWLLNISAQESHSYPKPTIAKLTFVSPQIISMTSTSTLQVLRPEILSGSFCLIFYLISPWSVPSFHDSLLNVTYQKLPYPTVLPILCFILLLSYTAIRLLFSTSFYFSLLSISPDRVNERRCFA